jgi:hypothetical protein
MDPTRKPKPKFKFRRTPPPNYNQRSTKMRVFAIVAAVILVLAVVERSRHPESWNWFLRTPEQDPVVNNRVEPKPSRTAHDPPGTIVQTSQNSPTDPEFEKPEPTEPTPAELAWRQGWKEIYPALDPTERTLLYEIMAQGRGEHQLTPAALDQASTLVVKLDENWNAYGEAAFQSLAALKEDEQQSWQAILRTANERWSKEARPALEAAAQGTAVSGEQLANLQRFQQSLDLLNLNLVRDDAPLRPDENEIYFRLMNAARHASAAELQQRLVKGVTYLQMYKQSHHYRGDVLSVRGVVRGAWRVRAANNPWGIENYYVFWIHPEGGPNAPIIVHLLSLPEGFPKVKDRSLDGTLTKLAEDVQVTGFFLKRQAYLAADGTRTAPLLLANTVSWDPESKTDPGATSRFEMTLPRFLWIASGTFCVALLAAGLIYWRVREEVRYSLHDESIANADISLLKDVEITPSTEEGLKQLERDQGRKE